MSLRNTLQRSIRRNLRNVSCYFHDIHRNAKGPGTRDTRISTAILNYMSHNRQRDCSLINSRPSRVFCLFSVTLLIRDVTIATKTQKTWPGYQTSILVVRADPASFAATVWSLFSQRNIIFYSLLRRWHTLKHDFLIRSTNALCNDRSIIVSEKSISPLWLILTQSYFTFCFDVSEKRKWHTIKLGRWNERDSKSKHRSVFRKRILRKDV